MHTENFVFDNCSQAQVIKDFCAISPNIKRAIFSETFIIEPINLSNLSTFVVSSDESDSIRISDLFALT